MDQTKESDINIGIVTFPTSDAGIIPLANLVSVLQPLSSDIYLVTGNKGYLLFKDNKKIYAYWVEHKTGTNRVTIIVNYILTQIKISYKLLIVNKDVNYWFFFLGGPSLLLPMLTAKLFKKDVTLVFGGSDIESVKAQSEVLSKPIEMLVKINLALSNRVVLYSPNLIKEWNLGKYKNKILIAPRHFLDFDKFKIKKKFDERDNLIGYIGRLSEEKGTLNFVKAIPEIMKERDDINFLIVGDGQLRDKIEEYLNKENLNNTVKIEGWIPHDELPDYLNELKLIVLPSYTEGLPNIMLEAMACGTPILATPVGAIPDVITDGETGFILWDNSPECIAGNVIRTLNQSDLDKIVKNAKELVENRYTYEAAVNRYKKIFEEIKKGDKNDREIWG